MSYNMYKMISAQSKYRGSRHFPYQSSQVLPVHLVAIRKPPSFSVFTINLLSSSYLQIREGLRNVQLSLWVNWANIAKRPGCRLLSPLIFSLIVIFIPSEANREGWQKKEWCCEAYCSCRGTRLRAQHPHGSCSWGPVLGYLEPRNLFYFTRVLGIHTCSTHIYMQPKHPCTYK